MEARQRRRGGLDDAEARRQALVAMGGIERTREDARDARGTRLLDDTARDVAYALRTLARRPGFTIVAVLTLAIGIGGTTAVFSAVNAVLLQPLPYAEPGRLLRLYQGSGQELAPHGFVTPVHFAEFRSRLSSFEGIAALAIYSDLGADIGTGDAVRRIRILPVSADYFDVLRAEPVIGTAFQRSDEVGTGPAEDNVFGGPSVILSHKLWESEFNSDPSALGKQLLMSGRSYTVMGVMPDGFTDPVKGAVDAWIPLDLRAAAIPDDADNHYLGVIARLKPGVTQAVAQSELDAVNRAIIEKYPNARNQFAVLYPLKADIVGDSSLSLEVMLGAVVLVLTLACLNIANLLLVRGSERARELAVRSALGAARRRLVRQLLLESVVLALAGGAAGMIIARLAMSAIVRMGSAIPRLASLHLDLPVLGFSLAIVSLSAIAFGLAPALRAARVDPGDVLRDEGRGATGGRTMRWREMLVVAQVALAFILLVGAGLLIASLGRLRDVDLGFSPQGALVFQLNLPDARYDSTARRQFQDALIADLARLPGVHAVGAISRLPATGPFHQWGVRALSGPLAGDPQRAEAGSQNRVVAGEYFKAAGIPLIQGRTFDERDAPGTGDKAVISKSLADRLFPGTSAVGQQLRAGGRTSEIIGVVGDVATVAEGRRDFIIYHPHDQWSGERNWPLTEVVRADGDLAALQAAARRVLAQRDPLLVMYQPMSLADAVGRGEAQRIFTTRLLSSFALVALGLSALGLFGVLSYSVRLRRREFSIRMALGADGATVQAMVLRQGLAMTALGAGIGLAGAVSLSRVMSGLVFQVKPLDPAVLASVLGITLAVATISTWVPAWRATAADPRAALQE